MISATFHIARIVRAAFVFAREGVFGAVDPSLVPPPGQLALRLARVKRYRDDKRADEADTMEAVRKIYAAQAGVQNA